MKKYSVVVTLIALAELIYILSGIVGAPRPETIAAQSRAFVAQSTAAPTGRMRATSAPSETIYIINTNTKRFHLPSCSSAQQIKDSNRVSLSIPREELIRRGYIPCQRCGP